MRSLQSLAACVLLATACANATAESGGSTFGAYDPPPQYTEHVSSSL